MKFTWGTGIFIFIAIYIISMVSFAIFFNQEDADLVSEDYYPREEQYQNDIDKLNNTNFLKNSLEISQNEQFVSILFPTDFKNKSTSGEVYMYRPSDKEMDITNQFILDSTLSVNISKQVLSKGRYEIKIDWNDSEKSYLHSSSINVR